MPASDWEHFTTSAVHPADRVTRWTEWGRQTFGESLVVLPASRAGFVAEMSRISLRSLSLARLRFNSARAQSLDPRLATTTEDAVVVSLPLRGRHSYRREGETSELRPGDIFVRDLRKPWELDASGEIELITLKLPFDFLAARVDDPAALLGKRLRGDRPEVSLASSTIRSALRLLEDYPTSTEPDDLEDLVVESLRLLTPKGQLEAAGAGARDVLRRGAMLYIQYHLGEPSLSSDGVATELGVSRRQVQRAFADGGRTVQEYILEQRLTRAARLVREMRDSSNRTVTAIAYDVGFSDISYFSRAFSRRFGISPRRFART